MQTGRTGVVRCDLVVRDSDVAQQVPSLEGAFGPSSSPDATPLAQLRASVPRPLLTMSDRPGDHLPRWHVAEGGVAGGRSGGLGPLAPAVVHRCVAGQAEHAGHD